MIENPLFSPWKSKNVWLLLSGQWISQMGNVLFSMAIYWYVLNTTGSRVDLGWVGAAGTAAGLFSIVAGVWVDQWDHRATMMLTDVVRFVLMGALAMGFAWSSHIPLGILLGMVALVNLGGAIFNPAQLAMVPDMIPLDGLDAVNGMDQSASSFAQWVGYAAGGFALKVVGVMGLVAVDAATFLASALTLWGIRSPKRNSHSVSESTTWRAVIGGQRMLWRHAFLKRALPTALVVNMTMMTLTVLDVAWAHQVLKGSPAVFWKAPWCLER